MLHSSHRFFGGWRRDSTRHLSCLLPIRRRISVFGLYSSNSRAGHYPCYWRGSMLEGLDIMLEPTQDTSNCSVKAIVVPQRCHLLSKSKVKALAPSFDFRLTGAVFSSHR
ncbi:hypothetical protein Tco_1410716 [Tanacetum coccineum]